MSDVLREHIQAFGFKHAEIARRASKLNQATTYRVVEGETQNPSLNSITGIIEAISLTDADAGVLYRKLGVGSAKPRLFVLPNGTLDYETAKRAAQNYLDSGHIRDAAHSVMAMFDLADNDEQRCAAYEQAGIVYMGLGRWEEAQVNFEAADAQLRCDIDASDTPQVIIDRKHTLMTNIGSLMVKRGNLSWALLFGRAVTSHPKVSSVNRGWGYLVLGEAALSLRNIVDAKLAFDTAVEIFQSDLRKITEDQQLDVHQRNRQCQQVQGNIRWTQIHILKSTLLLGEADAGQTLKELEAEWWSIDPEASAMAGFFYAEQMQSSKRRDVLLRDLKARAKRLRLGEIVQRITTLGCFCLFIGTNSVVVDLDLTESSSSVEEAVHMKTELRSATSTKKPWKIPARGNTGK